MNRRFSTLLLVVFLSVGCAGVGVVATSDPLVKLNDAEYLYIQQDRPLIAERLTREAMAIYQEQGDSHGLGSANRQYADILLSPSVSGKWAEYYRKNGFQDQSVTYDNRTTKAFEYYLKALEHYAESTEKLRNTNKYDALTNVYYNMASIYNRIGDRAKTCNYYEETLAAYNENIRLNPSARPISTFKTVSDLVAARKKQAGCT